MSPHCPAPEVISHLLTAIDDPNHYVCAAAVNSLGLLGAAQAIDQIEACLDDAEPIVVQAAILAMARIDPQRIETDCWRSYNQMSTWSIWLRQGARVATTDFAAVPILQACGI